MLDVTPRQREEDSEISAGESLDFSWGHGDFDPERLCPGEVWSFALGYGEAAPD